MPLVQGHDLNGTAAFATGFDVDIEDALEALCPGRYGVPSEEVQRLEDDMGSAVTIRCFALATT